MSGRFDWSRVDPDVRAAIRRLPVPPLGGIRRLRFARWLAARRRAAPIGEGVALRTLPGVGGRGIRIYRPRERVGSAALLWIHGGGLVMGSATADDGLCAMIAREVGIVVVSVDYRLAPEHRYPAAIDDCDDAWKWLQDNAVDLGVDPSKVVVGGGSAGGGLAAALVNRRRSLCGTSGPMAQWLLAPMLDDRTAVDPRFTSTKHPVWDNRSNRFGWSSYLGPEWPRGDVAPDAAAGRTRDFSGLPATFIGVGDIDLFFDEDCRYAESLGSTDVPVHLEVVEGAPHGFYRMAPGATVSRDFMRRALGWLSAVVTTQA